jgi:hypothetical protein
MWGHFLPVCVNRISMTEKIAEAIKAERFVNDALVKALEAILAEHDRVPFSYPTMPCVKDARSLLARLRGDKCPRCESSDPARHPAVQFEGEVRFCPHPFHSLAKEQGGE